MKDSNLRTPRPKRGGIAANRMRDKTWRTSRDSNPDEQFWRLSCCHYIRDTLFGDPDGIRTRDLHRDRVAH